MGITLKTLCSYLHFNFHKHNLDNVEFIYFLTFYRKQVQLGIESIMHDKHEILTLMLSNRCTVSKESKSKLRNNDLRHSTAKNSFPARVVFIKFYSVTPGKCRDSISIMSWSLPSKSFPSHYSPAYLPSDGMYVYKLAASGNETLEGYE
jgi:hypothetical protein